MKLKTTAASLLAFAALVPGQADAQTLDEIDRRLRAYDVQEVPVPQTAGARELFVVHLGEMPLILDLEPHSVLGDDFQLLVQTDRGIEPRPTPRTTTYRGAVANVPGGQVYASIHGGGLRAQIVLPWEQEVWVQPLQESPRGISGPAHIVYDRRDLIAGDETCGAGAGGPLSGPGGNSSGFPATPGSAGGQGAYKAAGGCFAITDIAFDADFEYFQANGSSVTNTVNDITGLMNSVDAIYRNSVDIVYEIGTILVRTTSDDPYASSGSGCGGFGILDEFTTEWNTNQGAIKRDVAALMTGKDLDGNTIGCAYIGTICGSLGYGINQARFTTNFAQRVGLVAHELGHNWSATHCDAEPGGCAIMCSGLGGCDNNLSTFSPTPAADISSFRQSRTCLSDVVNVDVAQAGGLCFGTSSEPYATLLQGAGCSLSTWVDRREVRVAPGTYSEGVLTLDAFVLLDPQGGVVRIE